MSQKIIVEFDMVIDEDGACAILPTERDLQRDQDGIDTVENDLASGSMVLEYPLKDELRTLIEYMKRRLRKRIEYRNRMLPHSKKHVYFFVRPTSRHIADAQEAAKYLNRVTGLFVVDETKVLHNLVYQCLQLPKPEIDDLDIVIAQYIERWIIISIGGAVPILPFMK